MTFVLWYQGMIALILLIVLWNCAGNLRYFRRLSSYPCADPGRQPFVSILVPARNEERNIARCIESLLAQEYLEFEVIVLNDNSSDRTAEILTELQARSPRLRVLPGKSLPAGWVGKNYACHQLAHAAKGDFLFFTDADTWHHPQTLAKSMSALNSEGGDLLSAIPQEEVQSLSERMVVPFMHFAVLCFLPLRWIWNHASPLFSFSVGQFMFFRRTAYERIGGHAAIPGRIGGGRGSRQADQTSRLQTASTGRKRHGLLPDVSQHKGGLGRLRQVDLRGLPLPIGAPGICWLRWRISSSWFLS